MFRSCALSLLTVLVAGWANAAEIYTDLLSEEAAMADDTYYDILRSTYSSARDSIEFLDVDEAAHPEGRFCIEIHPDRPWTESLVQVSRFTEFKEGIGKLLPAVNLTKVIYRYSAGAGYNSGEINAITTEKPNRREIKSELKYGEDNWQWRITLRKKDGKVIFRRDQRTQRWDQEEEENVEEVTTHYGFCYERPVWDEEASPIEPNP